MVCLFVRVRNADGLHTFRTNRTRPGTACDHQAGSLDIDRWSSCAAALDGNAH